MSDDQNISFQESNVVANTVSNSQAIQLISIENLINSHDAKVESLTKELKVQKEMLSNMLENNEEYAKAAEEAGKLVKLKTIAKQKVMKTDSAKTVVEKAKDLQTQLKELKVALSDYLAQYVSISGQNQFEGADGVTRQIIYNAKLVKKQDWL